MPSKNPRLSVVLTPGVAATLAAISKETGDSVSGLVRGLLEQTGPALERMLELIKAAKASKGQIAAGVAGSMDRVIDDLQGALQQADKATGQVLLDLVDQAESVKGRRRGGTGGARRAASSSLEVSTPVPVTRGSGTGKTRRTGVKRG